jgi:hypothetical protein
LIWLPVSFLVDFLAVFICSSLLSNFF